MLKDAGMSPRLLVFVGIAGLLSALAMASCSEGGTGNGTAPPAAPPCRDALDGGIPKAGEACNALQVCPYEKCDGVNPCVAYCPGPGSQWQLQTRGDGGAFADGEIPEVAIDASTDAPSDAPSDATDAPSDAADAAEAPDASDAVEPDAESDAPVDAPDAG